MNFLALVWLLWKDRWKKGGLGRKGLSWQLSSETVLARLIVSSWGKVAHWGAPLSHRNGPACVTHHAQPMSASCPGETWTLNECGCGPRCGGRVTYNPPQQESQAVQFSGFHGDLLRVPWIWMVKITFLFSLTSDWIVVFSLIVSEASGHTSISSKCVFLTNKYYRYFYINIIVVTGNLNMSFMLIITWNYGSC